MYMYVMWVRTATGVKQYVKMDGSKIQAPETPLELDRRLHPSPKIKGTIYIGTIADFDVTIRFTVHTQECVR